MRETQRLRGATDLISNRPLSLTAGAVCLVCDHMIGTATWAAGTKAGDAHAVQQRLRTDTVMALARGDQQGQGPAAAVAGKVKLGGQTSAGPTEGLTVRFVQWMHPPFRPVAAACWCARTMAESILCIRS